MKSLAGPGAENEKIVFAAENTKMNKQTSTFSDAPSC